MAKLSYVMLSSLDGFVEDAQGGIGWTAPDEDFNAYINDFISSCGTFLYGRRMYESMVYWEAAYAEHDLPQYLVDWAKYWQSAEKFVFSRTLSEPQSARTRIEREFDPDAIRRLKADATHDLTVSGAALAAHALREGLVDEVRMLVCPVVLGGGKRFLPEGLRLDLELVEERSFRKGVVALRYAIRR